MRPSSQLSTLERDPARDGLTVAAAVSKPDISASVQSVAKGSLITLGAGMDIGVQLSSKVAARARKLT